MYQSTLTTAPEHETLADPPIAATTTESPGPTGRVVDGVDEEGGIVVVGGTPTGREVEVEPLGVEPGGADDGVTSVGSVVSPGMLGASVDGDVEGATASVPITCGPRLRSPTTNETAANASNVATTVAAIHPTTIPVLLIDAM